MLDGGSAQAVPARPPKSELTTPVIPLCTLPTVYFILPGETYHWTRATISTPIETPGYHPLHSLYDRGTKRP